MDRQRAEAMHGYFEACRGLLVAEDEAIYTPAGSLAGERESAAYSRALDEEHAATEEALHEGVTLVELDALAAIAGSRFAPAWAVRAYGGGL